jgi:hypothetical protein
VIFAITITQKTLSSTHNTQMPSSPIDDTIESKPCPMASKSSDDGHKSHQTPLLMPPLASAALEAVNFALGLTKQPQRQHEDGAMAGWSCFSAQDVLGRGNG